MIFGYLEPPEKTRDERGAARLERPLVRTFQAFEKTEGPPTWA